MNRSPAEPLLRILGGFLAAGGRRRWFALLAIAALVALFLWRPELLDTGTPADAPRTGRLESNTERLPEARTGSGTADSGTARLRPAERESRPAEPPRLPDPSEASHGDAQQKTLVPPFRVPGDDRSTTQAERPASNATARPPDTRAAAPAQVSVPRNGETYRSPAGLVYTRGSAQGHRLRHVLEHAEDVPDRPGSHGVFQTQDLTGIVALIDEAYERAGQGRGTQRREEEGRLVLTVDMGRTIGYIGGQSGNRRGRPKARHLRMVLEDKRVITAYPLVP